MGLISSLSLEIYVKGPEDDDEPTDKLMANFVYTRVILIGIFQLV